ncbi:unnamed protein product [marine sediment metagenome]|uniref:Uncharacterized protein n=1 Tax=marine sediment metagenome TaxID=412755 RepID=X0UBA6_9ZZZZ
MSLYGEWLAATIGNGDTSSDEVDLGRDYDFLEVIIPTITTGTLKCQTAEKTGGDYLDLGNTANTTASGTHNYHDVWELGGWQFIKIVASAAQGGERLIRVRGMRF